jgi:hypothetical protein
MQKCLIIAAAAALSLGSLLLFATSPALAAGGHDKPHHKVFPPPQANLELSKKPAKPELVEPAALAKISGPSVTLKWKGAEGAEKYHLQVATDPNFKWLIEDQKTLTETSFNFSKAEPGKNYFWRVASVKSSNEPGFTKSYFTHSSFFAQSN